MKTVTIVGGGLAGLSLGIALRKESVPVVLYEQGSYPRHKVCGEFITGLRPETVNALGLSDWLRSVPVHHTVQWTLPDGRQRCDVLPAPVPAPSRYALDHFLASELVRLGGALRTGQRYEGPAEEGRVLTVGRPKSPARFLGIKAHIRGLPDAEGLAMHVGRYGYLGVSAVEDGWTNVCGLFDQRTRPTGRGPALLRSALESVGVPELARELRGAEFREGSVCVCAVSGFGRVQRGEDAGVRLGDSWGMPPPFTGHGMAMALESGILAAPALRLWSQNEQTWAETRAEIGLLLRKTFARRLRAGSFLHPFLRKPTGVRLLSQMSHAGILPFGMAFRLTHS